MVLIHIVYGRFHMKNDLVFGNILSVVKHSVKNEDILNLLWQRWKYGGHTSPLGIFLFDVKENEDQETLMTTLSNGGALFLFRHSNIFLTSWELVMTAIIFTAGTAGACGICDISWPHCGQMRCSFSYVKTTKEFAPQTPQDRPHTLLDKPRLALPWGLILP